MFHTTLKRLALPILAGSLALASTAPAQAEPTELLNVSYDIARECSRR